MNIIFIVIDITITIMNIDITIIVINIAITIITIILLSLPSYQWTPAYDDLPRSKRAKNSTAGNNWTEGSTLLIDTIVKIIKIIIDKIFKIIIYKIIKIIVVITASGSNWTEGRALVCFTKSTFQQQIKGLSLCTPPGYIKFRSKSFSSWDKSKGSQHLVKNGGPLHNRFPLWLFLAWSSEGWVKIYSVKVLHFSPCAATLKTCPKKKRFWIWIICTLEG